MTTKYTRSHEWIDQEAEFAVIGITDYAQKELGDVVYVELPPIGKELQGGHEACVLESTKAAADVYAPASGTVVAINERLKEQVHLINHSPEKEGWLFKLRLKDPAELEKLFERDAYLKQLS